MEEEQKRLRLGFRGPSSFLVSYAVHLSRGSLVVPVMGEVQVGEEIRLELELPDDNKITDDARVLAVHPDLSPCSLSVELNVSAKLADITDELVAKYTSDGDRLRVLVVAQDRHTRQNLKRSVRSTVASAQVGFAKTSGAAAPLLGDVPDLAVIDLDGEIEQTQTLWSICQSANPPLPSILIAEDQNMANELRRYGAWDVLINPPSSAEFRRVVLRTLARPVILEDGL